MTSRGRVTPRKSWPRRNASLYTFSTGRRRDATSRELSTGTSSYIRSMAPINKRPVRFLCSPNLLQIFPPLPPSSRSAVSSPLLLLPSSFFLSGENFFSSTAISRGVVFVSGRDGGEALTCNDYFYLFRKRWCKIIMYPSE